MTEMVSKLDDLGRPAWIGVMVLGFIFFWPLGLAVLAFLLWTGRAGCSSGSRSQWEQNMAQMQGKFDGWRRRSDRGPSAAFRATGNRAFDEYRSEMLKRLEDEADEFKGYLDRLRHAKDKAEFDQFMAERRNRPSDPSTGGATGGPTDGPIDVTPRTG